MTDIVIVFSDFLCQNCLVLQNVYVVYNKSFIIVLMRLSSFVVSSCSLYVAVRGKVV